MQWEGLKSSKDLEVTGMVMRVSVKVSLTCVCHDATVD
jgi:hypothetical protein